MAYRETTIMDVWDIIRRWHNRQGVREIARVTGFDRKTIKGYRRLAQAIGLSLDKPLPEKEEVFRMLLEHTKHSRLGRSPRAQILLLPYLDEIRDLINPIEPDLVLKAKTAFCVICERHSDLVGSVSYSSYKRFVHIHKLSLNPNLTTCRLEVEAGNEIQIDYARICMLFDSAIGRKRKLYAFIGTLSHSRMKFVELTFRQDKTSFVGSHIRMFSFLGGITQRINIDNLKAGVIKPDLYDPSLNRTYGEMIEYYGGFVDTSRVARPKDKGKVERDVQTVREAVRKLIVQNPAINLPELNRLIMDWSVNDYGQKEHGTTHEQPYTVFVKRERPALKSLPAEPFELATWKQATVHPDHYIQYAGKAYSVPHAYVGKIVWIKASERIVKVFYNERLIKQHVITSAYRHTDYDDFPENVRAALDSNFLHKKLLESASKIGPVFHGIINDLLNRHAFINLRRCQGLVGIAETVAETHQVEKAAALMKQHGIKATPQNLRHLIAKLNAEASAPRILPLSEATSEFIRDITYFTKN